jgi:AmmeMemoRadiSam system protein B/AmmeMemoRadiSam system protein A
MSGINRKNLITAIIFVSVIAAGAALAIFLLRPDQNKQLNLASLSESEENAAKITRRPVAAGAFYPASADELKKDIEQFVQKADVAEIDGSVKVLIVPHAGYVYSGSAAAYGYKVLANSFDSADSGARVILIGSSHHYPIRGLVLDNSDKWQTPLGEVEIDTELRDALAKENSLFKVDSTPHEPEHSLEVQAPFLQTIFSNFKILPVLVNELDEEDLESVSQILAEYADENTIFIASTDMSHYPSYKDANYADKKVIDAILTGEARRLKSVIAGLENENISNASTFLCGRQAVEIVMKVAGKIGANKINLLKYINSGDTEMGSRSRVVGYSSVVFISEKRGSELNRREQKELLKIARQTVESYIGQGIIPQFQVFFPMLEQKLGAFVTIKERGDLRGCIGLFEPDLPLHKVVLKMAIAAATKDTRFYPVQPSELADLTYEISVLSPLEKINNWRKIEAGKHGAQVRKGLRSGVFLPQVATENNWDREEFLENLCSQKAGLALDCYKDKDAELYIFTAQVFGE